MSSQDSINEKMKELKVELEEYSDPLFLALAKVIKEMDDLDPRLDQEMATILGDGEIQLYRILLEIITIFKQKLFEALIKMDYSGDQARSKAFSFVVSTFKIFASGLRNGNSHGQ